MNKDELILANQLLEKQLLNRGRAIDLIIKELWEIIPDENRIFLNEQLKKLGV